MRNNFKKWTIGSALILSIGGFSALLSGCGGGGGSNGSPSPTAAGTRTFYSGINSVLIGTSKLVKIGRSFVTLDAANHPVEIGLEMYNGAVNDVPLPETFGTPDAYGINLPPESVYTIFSFIAIASFSGHDPVGAGDIPHFHPVFGMGPPGQPDPANNFPQEKAPVAAIELPKDHEIINDVAGGIGQAVQDPAQPQAKVGWNSTGQNYFFYKGHMNAIALGATHDFLRRQKAGTAGPMSDVIKQPEIYPKAGYYPHKYTIRWDAKSRAHTFVFQDFRPATKVLP